MQTRSLWRSLFFAPADRHDLLSKFGRFDADNNVIDLEDGTPVEHKDSAREQLSTAVTAARGGAGLPGRLLVRINTWSGPFTMKDLQAALKCDVDGVVLPKLESPEELREIDSLITASGRPFQLVGGIESIAGVLNVLDCLRACANLRAVYFGAEDFITELGGRRSDEGQEVLYARQRVLLAAKSAGIAAIDQANVNIYSDESFQSDAVLGRNCGYDGKICLNPRQVRLANTHFAPDPDEIRYAQRLLAAVDAAPASGVLSFEGQMVDAPLIKRARKVVETAGLLGCAHA